MAPPKIKRIFSFSPHPQLKSTTSRKRNPYSIEELLKKPEKRRKIASENFSEKAETDADTANEEVNLNVDVCD
jgi:hypothetical protein